MAFSLHAGARRLCTRARGSEVVIVGAGIMGLNIAFQLRRRDPSLSITVFERAAALGAGSTGIFISLNTRTGAVTLRGTAPQILASWTRSSGS